MCQKQFISTYFIFNIYHVQHYYDQVFKDASKHHKLLHCLSRAPSQIAPANGACSSFTNTSKSHVSYRDKKNICKSKYSQYSAWKQNITSYFRLDISIRQLGQNELHSRSLFTCDQFLDNARTFIIHIYSDILII